MYWPDRDSSKKAIDAVCEDESTGRKLGIEHTLIQPFNGEKADTARFEKTLAALENDPALLSKGHLIEIDQPVGAIPAGVDWTKIQEQLAAQLENELHTMSGDSHRLLTAKGSGWEFELSVARSVIGPDYPGKVLVGRIWPGNPGPTLLIKALQDKVPKLSAFTEGKKILLLEKDGIAGTIEQQFAQLPNDRHISQLLNGLDEIWSANTAGLKTERVIFTNQVWPELRAFTCSLNFSNGSFWQRPSWPPVLLPRESPDDPIT
jgi:hypothetical protein